MWPQTWQLVLMFERPFRKISSLLVDLVYPSNCCGTCDEKTLWLKVLEQHASEFCRKPTASKDWYLRRWYFGSLAACTDRNVVNSRVTYKSDFSLKVTQISHNAARECIVYFWCEERLIVLNSFVFWTDTRSHQSRKCFLGPTKRWKLKKFAQCSCHNLRPPAEIRRSLAVAAYSVEA